MSKDIRLLTDIMTTCKVLTNVLLILYLIILVFQFTGVSLGRGGRLNVIVKAKYATLFLVRAMIFVLRGLKKINGVKVCYPFFKAKETNVLASCVLLKLLLDVYECRGATPRPTVES